MTSRNFLIVIALGICFFASAVPHIVSAETSEESQKKQLIQSLSEKLQSLQIQLAEVQNVNASSTTEPITVRLKDTSTSFTRLTNQYGSDTVEGKYYLEVAVTAGKDALYIPISITTARKSNGLIYQIEGTERATSSATVSCKGEDAVIVTSGSISYCKVAAGKTVPFKVLVTIGGPLRGEYRVVLGRVNYKLNPNDVRYKKLLVDIKTKLQKFR